MAGTNDAKRELRRVMRAVRREAALDPELSQAIVERLDAMPELRGARTVMLFDPMPGEPDLEVLGDRLRSRGVVVVVPDPVPSAPDPIDPSRIDVVVVPGMAFSRAGARVGQGVGWYDRLLARIRADCTTIGVCFDQQVVDEFPTVAHDVPVGVVITPTSVTKTDAAGIRDVS